MGNLEIASRNSWFGFGVIWFAKSCQVILYRQEAGEKNEKVKEAKKITCQGAVRLLFSIGLCGAAL